MSYISVVLIAAGESRRMGEPKVFLPWHGKTLLQHQLDTLNQKWINQIIVVLGHGAQGLVSQVRSEKAQTFVNPNFLEGKTTSIRLGIRKLAPDVKAVMVLAIDQPRTVGILEKLVKEHFEHGALVTVPEYEGHRGHPIIFSARLIPELLRIGEATQGLRAILEQHSGETHRVPFNSSLVLLDVNTREEYQEAQRQYSHC